MQIETPCPRLPRALARGSDEDFSGGPQEQPLDLLFILARTDRQCARRRVPIPRLAFTWPIPFNLWQNFELFPRSSGMIRLLPFLLLLLSFSVQAQKQLVLLKRGKPVGNFQEGVYIYLQLKDGTRSEGHIVELLEFTIITSNDTVPFNTIKRIGIPKEQRRGIAPLFGGLLLAGGVVYFGVDMINSALGYNPPGVDKQVATTSAVMIGVGSLLSFIRPKYRRVNMGTFLRTVDYKSKFYKSPT